jgi:hypothetical protein
MNPTITILVLYASAVTRPLAVQTFQDAKRLLKREVGIEIHGRFREAGRIGAHSVNPGEPYSRDRFHPLFRYTELAWNSNPKEGERVLILFRLGRYAPIAGQAAICGDLIGSGIRPNRRRQNRLILAHELGHSLGATHTAGGLMDPFPLRGKSHKFSEGNQLEIAKCMGRQSEKETNS